MTTIYRSAFWAGGAGGMLSSPDRLCAACSARIVPPDEVVVLTTCSDLVEGISGPITIYCVTCGVQKAQAEGQTVSSVGQEHVEQRNKRSWPSWWHSLPPKRKKTTP